MQYSTFALLATLAYTATASPAIKLGKRDWAGDNNGNLKITFSDETIKLGDIPTDTVIGKISDACSGNGLCDTSPVTIDGTLTGAGATGSVNDETLTINPSGSYPSWIHNGLIDAMKAAVNVAAKCTTETKTPNCGFSPNYCPAKPYQVTQCVVPQYWGISYQPADLGNSAPPFIGADMSIEVDTGDFCSQLTTIGGAVAGAVNGVAGGIFSLIGLFCK